jgi:hypothetical protein
VCLPQPCDRRGVARAGVTSRAAAGQHDGRAKEAQQLLGAWLGPENVDIASSDAIQVAKVGVNCNVVPVLASGIGTCCTSARSGHPLVTLWSTELSLSRTRTALVRTAGLAFRP